MGQKYDHKKVEKKWQDFWEKEGLYKAEDFGKKKKFYLLIEFPYPSGAGLHVGHARSWSSMDAFARKKRMQGANVLYPIGWDAFGLPAENYAIKTGLHPTKTVSENIKKFKTQIKSLGISFDWSREINTSDPSYYKWTQWIFVQLLKKKLAYQAEVAVNWCPFCKTNLADEEVLADGRHERCGRMTERRMQKQWLLKITKYADRLLQGLRQVDYSPEIAAQEVNWIGKSEGAEITFKIEGLKQTLKVFTTRPDTLYGVTFMVVSPESPWVEKLTGEDKKKEVEAYVKQKAFRGKGSTKREKTGVFSGSYALNPATGKKIPIWISDYVLSGYGSGAIMAVPAHDARDWEFAKKFGLEITEVISGGNVKEAAYEGDGEMVNSDSWNGIYVAKDIRKIYSDIEKRGWGKKGIEYHIHDWIFSRQHYWGEPIPVVHCPKCGAVPVPEKDLPVELPYIENYKPSGTGESPLANAPESWLKVKCPRCGEAGRRETDTMPNWAGSNWYFIRYLDPDYQKGLADPGKMKHWLPVDIYQGGFEHTTLHLLYSRFIYKFLYDIGVVPTEEPYLKRRSHGIVLGSDGRKMSKSFGNVVNPDEISDKFGADTLRLYEMFMGPFDQSINWSEEGVEGCFRFLGRVWRLFSDNVSDRKSSDILITKLHQTIKKVDSDIENLKFNTAVSALMEFSNLWNFEGSLNQSEAKLFCLLLAPFAPHMAEEVWQNILGSNTSIHGHTWPKYEESLAREEKVEIAIQVNGKLRSTIEIEKDKEKNERYIVERAKDDEKASKWIKKGIKKTIFVPGKLVNFVV